MTGENHLYFRGPYKPENKSRLWNLQLDVYTGLVNDAHADVWKGTVGVARLSIP
jgi:hypothetical protein